MAGNSAKPSGCSVRWMVLRLILPVCLGSVCVLVLNLSLVSPVSASLLFDGLPPLPRECGGVNPPGYPVPVCCLFGYVPYASPALTEPLVAGGAVVTLTTQAGIITSTVTAPGWLNPVGQPYFRFDLDAAGVEPGDTVTVTAAYLERQAEVVYQVVPGGQQVDVVLPQEAITVVVDDQDTAASPDDLGYHIVGPVEVLTEAACGPGSEFWGGAIYSGTTTAGGVGPATIMATIRPTLPVAGAYELFAYAPHGCATAFPRYVVHIDGGETITTMVDQGTAGASGGQWISLGVFDFPAGSGSYVEVTNLTHQPGQTIIGFDALKWQLVAPSPLSAVVTVDDLDTAATPDDVGFYKSNVIWGEQDTTCDGSALAPLYWEGHIHWTYTIAAGPPVNWAQWRADLPQDGLYDVYVFVPMCFATARTARYRVYGGWVLLDQVTVDQGPQGSVWVHLGTYALLAGTSSRVYLDDVTGIPSQMLAFDAVRWVLRPHFQPVATIHSIRPSSAIQGQDTVVLRGSGVDTDNDGESVVAYEWRSERDGLLGTGATLTIAADALSAGTHVITFRVQDDEGLWSDPVTTHLEVQQAGPLESWHLMLYFAGDNNLSYYFAEALQRLQQLAIPANVTVTVLLDRPGSSGVTRYLFSSTRSETWNLSEQNTGVPQTLAGYILWAQENHPADRYYLAVANHGRGIQGIAWDDTSNDYLTVPELGLALQQGTDNGLLKIDVLHLDACLMAMIEVGYEVWPFADYMIASENIAWALLGYDQYVRLLGPSTTPRGLAESIAGTYHRSVGTYPHTISVLDLQQMGDLTGRVDTLARAMLSALPTETLTLSATLAQVQRFDSRDYGVIDGRDEFVDLVHLAQLWETSMGDEAVRLAAQAVLSTTVVVTEAHVSERYGTWWDLENANGLAIYFPSTTSAWDYGDYISPTLRFGYDTYWDELLVAWLGGMGGLPPDDPGLPPLPAPRYIYMPLVLRGS